MIPTPTRRSRPVADAVALAVLVLICVLWVAATGPRLDELHTDQGWFLQVADRVRNGESLYGDVIWMYGPLPVWLLALLLDLTGGHLAALSLFSGLLAALGLTLAYRAARYLLPPLLAFVVIAAVSLGGWWGGLLGYTQAYTGAVPLGAVCGLAVVVSLLRAGRDPRARWPVIAGLATAAAILTKQEFALAALGTGVLALGSRAFRRGHDGQESPGAWQRGNVGSALLIFLVLALAIPGFVLAIVAARSGVGNVLAGFTGYRQGAMMLRAWPPWGTPQSWGAIVSGAGLWLVGLIAILAWARPDLARRRWPMLGAALVLAAALFLARRYLPILGSGTAPAGVFLSDAAPAERTLRLIWAPVAPLAGAVAVWLAIAWLRTSRRRLPASNDPPSPQGLPAHWCEMWVLACYAALASARSFLHPLGTLHFHYVLPAAILLTYLVTSWIPRAWGGRGAVGFMPTALWRARALAIVGFTACTILGLIWDAAYFRQPVLTIQTARGEVRLASNAYRKVAWTELVGLIQERTGPGGAIAVLGHDPGTYYVTGRRNVLRQDTMLPGMALSPQDVAEILLHLRQARPPLIILSEGVVNRRIWFWASLEGEEALVTLEPVVRWLEGEYRLSAMIGQEWGYSVYEPLP